MAAMNEGEAAEMIVVEFEYPNIGFSCFQTII